MPAQILPIRMRLYHKDRVETFPRPDDPDDMLTIPEALKMAADHIQRDPRGGFTIHAGDLLMAIGGIRISMVFKGSFGEPSMDCPSCNVRAVCFLNPAQEADQPDLHPSTHVCHPAHGGCCQGFSLIVA